MKIPVVFLFAGALAAFSTIAGIPLPEHPRPDFERTDWVNLNGEWDFRFEGEARFERKIVVPFGWGCPASGVKDLGDTAWYRKTLTVPPAWKGRRVFVVVGASDHDTTAFFGGVDLGRHSGGYDPFEFELTREIKWGEPQTLEFKVWDPNEKEALAGPYLYGKQGYGNARGIWQTVYLEARGDVFVRRVRFEPNVHDSSVAVRVTVAPPAKKPMVCRVSLPEKTVALPVAAGQQEVSGTIPLEKPHLWTPDDPHLYDATVQLFKLEPQTSNLKLQTSNLKLQTSPLDEVHTYFGFRSIGTVKTSAGNWYVALNGRPLYLQMCLDQSYHPEGWYTYPSDEAIKNDLLITKHLGLTGNRIHLKAEIPRKLYWADKLGVLIQADLPSAWGNPSEAMYDELWRCFEAMVERDFNHPSVYQWTLFNESWGLRSNRSLKMGLAAGQGGGAPVYRESEQRRVAEMYAKAKALDPTRLVEDNSTCNRDHVVTDVNSFHKYRPGWDWEREVAERCAKMAPGCTENYIGGHVQGEVPMMNSECGNVWGYKGSTGDIDYSWDYHLMINAFRRHLKCAGWLYTEHHDVINEWNGYVRYDRTWKETGIEELSPGMTLADFHRDAYLPLDGELCRAFAPGADYVVPVDVSLVTDRYAGKVPTLSYTLNYLNSEGRWIATRPTLVDVGVRRLGAWTCSRLAEVKVALPDEAACGTICFTLAVEGRTIARNFQCFFVRDGLLADARPCAAEWSLKRWEAVGGAKVCGAGSGYFEYDFDVSGKAGCVFRAEVATKRLNGKDERSGFDAGKRKDVDYVLGGGDMRRSGNANSYPQTSVYKYPGEVEVWANGEKLATVRLPDDPADHRGILSWFSQKRPAELMTHWPGNVTLDEPGGYGYLVEAAIPKRIVDAAKGGRLKVRLVARKTGLAVYGREAGRYPFGPHLRESEIPQAVAEKTQANGFRVNVRQEWTRNLLGDDYGRYVGWPTLTKLRSGELVAVFSGDREGHVCPYGKVMLVRSRDQGETWSKPVAVCDGPIDDRDAGLLELRNGDLVLFWFTSLAFIEYKSYYEKHPEYLEIGKKVPDDLKRKALGSWARRSTDGGRTWSDPVRVPVMTPHGGRQLRDGRILVVGKHNSQTAGVLRDDKMQEPSYFAAVESTDGGRTFREIGRIERKGLRDHWSLAEPSFVEAPDGTLTAYFRYELAPDGTWSNQKVYPRFMYRSVSTDGGHTWSDMAQAELDGFPPHFLDLGEGRVLCTYGSRTPGRTGIYAAFSTDGGRNFDAANERCVYRTPFEDCGYPSTVKLDDGAFLSVFYAYPRRGVPAALTGVKWRMK